MKKTQKITGHLSKNVWYIITAISCFIPLGLIVAVIYTIFEVKYNPYQNKKILHSATASLIFSLFMSGYILFVSFTGNLGTYTLALMYIPALVISIYLFCVYIVLSRRAKIFRQCILLIQQEHITDVSHISEIIGISDTKAVSALKKLIKMGELDGAELDSSNKEIIFKKSIWAKQKVLCRSCGANLIVNLGQTLTCEYCNGALEIQNK